MTSPIEQIWQSYAAEVLPRDASETQRLETRRAFFAGALGSFKAIEDASDVEAEAFAVFSAIKLELMAYATQLDTPAETAESFVKATKDSPFELDIVERSKQKLVELTITWRDYHLHELAPARIPFFVARVCEAVARHCRSAVAENKVSKLPMVPGGDA